ncbi:MAG: hypothetical protein KBS97_00735 [Firmicutes bacterium]|nr:hypothetical protein [Candidatus Fiminaster equi]
MKVVIKILNLVYLVIAAVAITCFFTKPYIDIDGGYKIQSDQLSSMVKDAAGKDITGDEVDEIVKDKTVDIKVKATVEAKYVLKFTDKEGLKNSITEPLEEAKTNVMNDITPILEDVVHKTATNVAKKIIRESVENKIVELSPTTDRDKAMSDAGLNEEYFSTFAEDVYKKATEEDPTIDKVMDEVVTDRMKDVASRLANQAHVEEFADTTKIGNEMTESVRIEMKNKFIENEFCDADGKIVNLKQKIRDTLQGKLNETLDGFASSFSEYSLYYFIALMAFVAPWAVLAIVSIIRIIRRKKCWVKSWYVFVFASIQLLLGITLTIATSKFLPQIAGVLPMEEFKSVLSSLTLNVTTSSFIPSILYLALIPFTIVYTILAHRVKKNYKKEKRA